MRKLFIDVLLALAVMNKNNLHAHCLSILVLTKTLHLSLGCHQFAFACSQIAIL